MRYTVLAFAALFAVASCVGMFVPERKFAVAAQPFPVNSISEKRFDFIAMRYELAPGHQLKSFINGLSDCQLSASKAKAEVCSSNWLWQLARAGENYIELELTKQAANSSEAEVALQGTLLAFNKGDQEPIEVGKLAIKSAGLTENEAAIFAYTLTAPMDIGFLQSHKHRLRRTAKYFRDN